MATLEQMKAELKLREEKIIELYRQDHAIRKEIRSLQTIRLALLRRIKFLEKGDN